MSCVRDFHEFIEARGQSYDQIERIFKLRHQDNLKCIFVRGNRYIVDRDADEEMCPEHREDVACVCVKGIRRIYPVKDIVRVVRQFKSTYNHYAAG